MTSRPSGIWLEVKLRGGLLYRVDPATGRIAGSTFPGVVVGYRHRRIVVGLGVDFRIYEYEQGSSGRLDQHQFMLTPLLQVHFARRGPVALYAQVGAGYGYGELDAGTFENQTHLFAGNTAVGARYFLIPRFAIGAEIGAGVRVLWTKRKDGTGGASYRARDVELDLFGGLTAAAVW